MIEGIPVSNFSSACALAAVVVFKTGNFLLEDNAELDEILRFGTKEDAMFCGYSFKV